MSAPIPARHAAQLEADDSGLRQFAPHKSEKGCVRSPKIDTKQNGATISHNLPLTLDDPNRRQEEGLARATAHHPVRGKETDPQKDADGHALVLSPPDVHDALVYELDPLRDPRWQEFVESHPRASVFHSLSWLRALNSAYGYEPVALATAAPGQRLRSALLFCRVKSWLTNSRIVSLPFSDHCEPLLDGNDDLDAMLGYLQHAKWRDVAGYIELRPLLSRPGCDTEFIASEQYFSHIIELNDTADVLFRSFHKNCVQRKIRRAEREALTYETGNSESLISEFYQLLVKSRRRQGLPPQPFYWFQNLSAAFGDRLQVRVASRHGRPIASILTLKFGSTITYKYGCSEARFNNLGGMALLLWRTIQEALDERFTQFDLGRCDIDNTGLITFKEHWGAQRGPLTYWRYPDCRLEGSKQTAKEAMRRMAKIAPEWCLIGAGRLLYPHIG